MRRREHADVLGRMRKHPNTYHVLRLEDGYGDGDVLGRMRKHHNLTTVLRLALADVHARLQKDLIQVRNLAILQQIVRCLPWPS